MEHSFHFPSYSLISEGNADKSRSHFGALSLNQTTKFILFFVYLPPKPLHLSLSLPLSLDMTKIHPVSSSLVQERQQEWWRQILHPSGEIVTNWNRIFFAICLIALFVDPLFFYLFRFLPGRNCLMMEYHLAGIIVITRTIVDLFSIIHILIKFRTAYVAPNSTVFGRGDLVTDPDLIAIRYLKGNFVIDLSAALPLPQVLYHMHFLFLFLFCFFV